MAHPVFLLHGIARTSRHMQKLADYLSTQGFIPHNLNYPSTRYNISALVDRLHSVIETVIQNPDQSVHFVGYSMGGLIIRAYLQRHRPQHLGRVVMLGTPNQGSEVANALQSFWPYRQFYGPAGQQLITDQTDFAHLFGPTGYKADYDLGIIAGNKPLDPFCSWLIGRHKTDKANDGKVSVASTHLDGMRDHLVLPVNHTFMPSNKAVLQQTAHFLHHGMFKRTAS